MKRFITLGVIAILVLGFIVGCEEDEDLESQSLLSVVPENGYLPFPQDSSEIPDPDTLEDYPYNPNINIPIDFTVLGYTEYPEPDSSEIDSADWDIWIPKAEGMPPIAEFLALPRTLPAETTLVRMFAEDPDEDTTGGNTIMSNDCSFSKNKRGDILLTRGKWYLLYGFWTHALIWLPKDKYDSSYTDKECMTAHKAKKGSSRNGVHPEAASDVNAWYKRCAVFRVKTSPKPTSLRSQAGDYAEVQKGKPYNLNINWKYSKKKFYCSQLCWAGYYWKSNKKVNVDVYIPGLPGFSFAPDWHVLPDELFMSRKTYKIADSK